MLILNVSRTLYEGLDNDLFVKGPPTLRQLILNSHAIDYSPITIKWILGYLEIMDGFTHNILSDPGM